ncbi:MAG: DEAD/DEAH box helicase [Candidatus Margulisiibacteriota bacterium]
MKNRDWADQIAALSNEYLYFEYYTDIVTGKKMNLENACDILLKADAILKQYLPQWESRGVLYTLDPTGEGEKLEPKAREEVILVKQALSATINLLFTAETIAKKGNQGESEQSEALQNLKLQTASNYNQFLKGRDMRKYVHYVFGDNPGLGAFNKQDVEILSELMKYSQIKDIETILAKLKALQENEDAWNPNGTLKKDHEGEEILEDLSIKMYQGDDTTYHVGNPGDIIAAMKEAGGFLNYILPLNNDEWVENFKKNMGNDWGSKLFDEIFSANFAKEFGCQFLFQQVMFRYLMLKYIYWDLGGEMIDGLLNGDLTSLKHLPALLVWQRFVFIWYRDFWNELEQGHIGNALAIFYAINYLTFRGGWQSIWGKTLTLDAEILKALCKVPGLEKGFSYLNKRFPRFEKAMKAWSRGFMKTGLETEWFRERTPTLRKLNIKPEDSKKVRFIKGTLKNLLKGTLISPWLALEDGAHSLAQQDGKIRHAAKIWTWPMDYLFGLGEAGFDLGIRGIKYPFKKGYQLLSPTAKALANGESPRLNPIDIKAEVEIKKGNSFEGKGNADLLVKLLEQAKKGTGDLAALVYDKKNGKFIIKKTFKIEVDGKIEEKTYNLEVVKVRTVEGIKGPKFVVVIPHGATEADYKVWLHLPEDFNSNTLQAAVDEFKAAELEKPEEVNDMPKLEGKPLDAKANEALLEQVKLPAKEARADGLEIVKQYANDHKGFWEKFKQNYLDLKAGKIDIHEFRPWETAAYKIATIDPQNNLPEGKTLRLVQMQAITLLGAGENTLLQFGTGEGKTTVALLTALEAAAKGEKVYIFTTGDSLVKQFETGEDKPLLEMLKKAGLKVGLLTSEITDPDKRAKIYQESNVIIMDIASHAFDLSKGEIPKGVIKPGFVIADEWDLYSIENAATSYTIASPQGLTGNFLIDGSNWIRLQWKWKANANQTFKKLLKANQKLIKQNKTGEDLYLDKKGRYTKKGIEFIKKNYSLIPGRKVPYSSFIQKQFESLAKAWTLFNEKTDQEERKKLESQGKSLLSSQIKFRFKYNEKGRITGIIPMEESGEESPNKKFGWGLDEALRAVSSLWIEGETVTLSDIDILQVYKHHNSLMGLSGSMGAAHEIAKVAYGEDFDFRVVEIPSFIPKLVLTPDDLANLAKPQVQEKIDKWIKAVKEVAELGDTGAPSKKTYAKIVLQGIEPDSLELKSFLDQAVKAIGNRKIAIVHHEKIFILEKKARVKAAVAEVIEKAASQRPTFVSLETEEEFKDFKELLKNAGIKFQTFTGEDFADNKKEIEKIEAEIKKSGECKMGDYIFKKEGLLKKLVAYKNEDGKLVKVPEKEIQEIIREAKMSQAGELGMVTLSYFSRGLDIQAKTALDQLLETASEKAEKLAAAEAEAAPKIAQGGLHVISLGAGTEAKIIQQIGRTGRSYHPGSATVYTGKGDALYQIYKEETEALEKLVKGHEGEAFSLYDPQNQELIEKVNEVFKKGYQKNFEALLDTFKYSEMKYKLLNLMNNLSSNAAAPLKFAEIAIKAHVELLLKKYGVEDGKPLSAEVKAQLEKELGKMLGKRKVTLEISAGKINAKALANIMARRIMKLFTSLRQGDVNNPVTNPKYPTCAGASCGEISKMTIELQTIVGETYAEVIEELEKLNHLDTANMGRDFIEKEMERVVGRAKGALLAKLFKNWFPNKTPLLGSQAIKNAARPGTGSIVITDAGSDPKTGDLVFKFTGKERKKLRKTGAFLKDGVLFLFNKSVSEFPYRAVDLNGLSCKKIKKGTYEFSYDGKKQIYSAAQIWKVLSTGRKILGVEVTIRSADSKLALPEPAGTVSSGPIIPLQSVFKLSLGDVIPAPEAEVEFQKIDPAKVDNLQDLIAEIKKVADEDALLLFESKGTVKIRGRAKDFKAWKNSLISAQELLLYLKSTGQVDKYSKITAMLTKHHLKEAELQYKLFGEEAKITVEIDGEKIEVPAKLVADIQRGKKALARIREAIIKANPDLSPAYIDNVIKANAPDIFAKIDKSSKKYLKFEVARMTVAGTKAQLLELLDTVKVEITLEDGKKLLLTVNNQDAKDFLSNDPELQEKARQNIIKKIGEIAEDAEIGDVFKILKPEQVLDQLKLQMKTLRTNLEASQFAQQKLMQKQVEFQQQELKKIQKQLKKADSQEGFELLEKASIKAAMAVEAYRLTFENMLNNHFASSGKKTISKDELEKIWKEAETEMAKIEGQDLLSQKKYLEYLKKGMPGANKVAKIGNRTVKDGILGLTVGLVLEPGTELGNLLAGEGFDFAKVLKNTGEQGLHWARFGLMAGASEHLLGWSETLSMYGAMVIPALWDLGNPDLPFEMKGQVFVQHALGLGGFIGGMGLAKRGIAPKLPKVGGWATLAFGMASAWGLGKLHNEIYAASESYRSIVDSKVMNSIGSFLGETSDYVTVAWGSSLAASGLASIGTTLVELDALGSAFGVEASFGGASTFFSKGASIISRAAGPLIVLGLCKGFFSTLYDISNSDYEKVIAQRLGNRMWNKTCDNTEAGCWAAEAIGGEFKFDQQVEGFAEWLNKVNMERKKWTGGMDPVYYKHEGPDPTSLYLKTPPQYYPKAADLEDAFVTNTIETVAKDFSDSLSLAGSIPGNFNLSALDFILKNITGNVENDYESALNFVQSQVQPLTQPVSLNEYEQKIYKAVLENLKGTTGFDDPKLIGVVKNFYIDEFHYGDGPDSLDNDCDGSEECEDMADEPLMSAEEATVKAIAKAKGLLKKFKILFYHNNVNYISLINPQDMGKELYEYLNFYVNEAPKINRQNSAKKATLWKNFKKQHPEIAKKIEEKKQLNPPEHDIFFKEYGLPSANIPQNIQNPFEDTAIMKMAKVQKAHDTFAKFFDSTGRLLPDKAKAFAKWILSKKIHGIKQENLKWMNGKTLKQILEEYPKRLKENRANYLLAATLGAERMFELVRMYLDQGTIQPTDDDIKMGLVRKNSLTGNWEINPENPIHKAWEDCKAVPENVHLVVAKLANPTDVKLGLVDENGYLDLDNPYIKKVFGPVQKNIFKTAAKQGKKIEKEFQEAEANLKEWQENYANFMGYQLNYTKQYGILLENGESTENIEKKLAWAAKNLNLIMKKKLPKAMRLHAEAQGQLAGLKITIITLQIQYLKGTDPLKKEILAAQIKGFGGSIENITPKYVDTVTKILELLQTPELRKDPKLFAEYINKLLNLEKSSKELELAKT